MKAMLPGPYDPVARPHPKAFQNRKKSNIKRYQDTVFGVGANLPKDRARILEYPTALTEHNTLFFDIVLQCLS